MKIQFTSVDIALASLAFVWALNFTVIKASLVEIDPYSFNALRFILASVCIWGVLFYKRAWYKIPKKTWGPILLLGLLGNLGYQWLFIAGIDLTYASNAAVMLGTIPVWVAIFSHLSGIEKLNSFKTAGVVAAFGGVFLISAGNKSGLSFESATIFGDFLIILAAMVWAAYTIMSKKYLSNFTPLQFSSVMITIGMISLTLLAIPNINDTNWSNVSYAAYGGAVYSGALAIGLAYLVWNSGIVKVGTVRTAAYQNMVPVLGMGFGIILLNEYLNLTQTIGAIAVVAGIILTRLKK